MPSKHPRIAVTADPELGDAWRGFGATGTREADATLLRRLAVGGAEAELEAGRNRRVAAEALLEAIDGDRFDLDLEASIVLTRRLRLMPVRLWDGSRPPLTNTSAWMQARRDAKARSGFWADRARRRPLVLARRYELMVDARVSTESLRSSAPSTACGFPSIWCAASALATMRELAARAHRAHRFPLPTSPWPLPPRRPRRHPPLRRAHQRLGEHLGVEANWISEP